MSDLVKRARLAAQEMRDENQNGWPNLVDELAAHIEALEAALKPFADRYTWIIEMFGEDHRSGQIMVDWDAVEVAASLLEPKT